MLIDNILSELEASVVMLESAIFVQNREGDKEENNERISESLDRICFFSHKLRGAAWVSGFAIEVIADQQKKKFRRESKNKGKFIHTGLWAWSRHPNYFGEIILWIGVAVIALPVLSGWRWVALISPIFVTILLTRISGIPILERRAETQWGGKDDYKTYAANTPMLLPRPPKAKLK